MMNIIDNMSSFIDGNEFKKQVDKIKQELTGRQFYQMILFNDNDKYAKINKEICQANGEKYFIECLASEIEHITFELIKIIRDYGLDGMKIPSELKDRTATMMDFYECPPVISTIQPGACLVRKVLAYLYALYKNDDKNAKYALQSVMSARFPEIYKVIRKCKKMSADEILSASDDLGAKFSDENFDQFAFSHFMPRFAITLYMCELFDIEFDETAEDLYYQIGFIISSRISAYNDGYLVYKDYNDLEITGDAVYAIDNNLLVNDGKDLDINEINDIDQILFNPMLVSNSGMETVDALTKRCNGAMMDYLQSKRRPSSLKKIDLTIQEFLGETLTRYGFAKSSVENIIDTDISTTKIYAGYRFGKMLEEKGIDPDQEMDRALFIGVIDTISMLGYTLSNYDYLCTVVAKQAVNLDVEVSASKYEVIKKLYEKRAGIKPVEKEYIKHEEKKEEIFENEKLLALQEENKKLKDQLSAARKENEDLNKKKRQLKGEISHYKDLYNCKKNEFDTYVTSHEVAQEEHDELIHLRDYVYSLTENAEAEKKEEITVSDMKEFIKNKNVVIIGGHQNWTSKLKELFPKWKYIRPDSKMSVETMKTDYVFFFTDCLKHSTYYKNVAYLGEHGLPFGFIHSINIDNNIRQVYSVFSEN